MVKRKGPGESYLKSVWDPAGRDRRLATTTQELRVGRYALAGELLAEQVPEDVRDYRYLILAQIAASNGADTVWLAEEPASPEAALLRLRANVIRALKAHRSNHPQAEGLVELTRAQCLESAERFPEDPLPWIALLHLAPAAAPDNVPGPPELAIAGPWRTMGQLWRRDPWNREAHHRLLAAVGPKSGGSVSAVSGVAHWIASQAPAGSALLVLQLVAFTESFRQQLERNDLNKVLLTYRNWSTAYAQQEMERCYQQWFLPNGGNGALLPDLHHLAHALWAGSQWQPGAQVFDAIGPYALTTPWSLHGDPAQVLPMARERCMSGF